MVFSALFGSKTSTEQRLREQQIQRLVSVEGVRSIDASHYEATVSTRRGRLRYNVDLPREFPEQAPVVRFPFSVQHPWVDNRGYVVGMRDLAQWTPQKDLGRVINELNQQFIASPPVFVPAKRVSGAGPNAGAAVNHPGAARAGMYPGLESRAHQPPPPNSQRPAHMANPGGYPVAQPGFSVPPHSHSAPPYAQQHSGFHPQPQQQHAPAPGGHFPPASYNAMGAPRSSPMHSSSGQQFYQPRHSAGPGSLQVPGSDGRERSHSAASATSYPFDRSSASPQLGAQPSPAAAASATLAQPPIERPAIPTEFPMLDAKRIDELQELLVIDESRDEFLKREFSFLARLTARRDETKAIVESLEDTSPSDTQERELLETQAKELRDKLEGERANARKLQERVDAVRARRHPSVLEARLDDAVAEAEALADSLVSQFHDDELSHVDFIKQFRRQKVLQHSRKERLKRLRASLGLGAHASPHYGSGS